MVTIGHACQDENGGTGKNGAQKGDQTGREIRTQEWYDRASSGGWEVYLEPLDAAMADRAATIDEQICADPAFGYSQGDRWSAYKSILANGGIVQGASGDADCASLVWLAYILAGLNIKAEGYCGNLEERFMATGKFRAYRDAAHLASGDLSVRGGLYLRGVGKRHVAMVLYNTNAPAVQPTIPIVPESVEIIDELVQPPYVQTYGRVRVRRGPATTFEKMYTSKDERLPYTRTDDATGWHEVETEMGIGWVSGKPNLTRVVLV